MSIVIKARRTEEGIIIHEHDDGSSKQYIAVRGGLSWPIMAENLPGYFCILGEEWISAALRKQNQRGKLILLSEYEAPDNRTPLGAIFTRLIHDAALYLCGPIYTVTEEFQGEDYRGLAADFQKFTYGKENTGRIEQAPWADSPERGLRYISDWHVAGLLELPAGSLVHEQLRMMEPEKVKQVPLKFNAVNALRFVVCGFQNDKPNPDRGDWRKNDRQGTWRVA